MKLNCEAEYDPIVTHLDLAVEADDELKLFAHSAFYKYMDEYTPMQEGMLISNVRISPDGIDYFSPYAHYQYEGIVYAPNFPIKDKDGNIIGWRSPPQKFPTDRHLTYRTDLHPLAQSHWDAAAIAAHGQDLTDEITSFIVNRVLGG